MFRSVDLRSTIFGDVTSLLEYTTEIYSLGSVK